MSAELEVKRGFDEVRPVFQKLRGLELIIVGGQVVNFWAAQFLPAAPELSLYSPFVSRRPCDAMSQEFGSGEKVGA